MMLRRIATACALGAVVAASASAQTDPRWRAWTGCWALAPEMAQIGAKSTACVVPTEKPSAVEILTIVAGKVTDRTRVDADGQTHDVSRDGCTSTETARWSASGTRVYITETTKCGDTPERRGTGIMSFTQQYSWLDVRGISAGSASGVAVAKYDVLSDTAGLPEEAIRVIAARGTASNNATLAASAPLTLADIAEVGTTSDSGVAATWLMERTRGVLLSLDGKQLTMLADQGTPASVIDVLVAISHPRVFALNTGGPSVREQPKTSSTRLDNSYWRRYPSYYGSYTSAFYDPWFSFYDPFFDPYGYYRSRYGYYGYGYGTGYGYGAYSPYVGYYPGSQPIIVVNRPPEDSRSHGRVVKGRGYTSGSSGSSGSYSSPSSSSSSGGSSSGSSSSGSSPGSSSGGTVAPTTSGGDRTAVRKPPSTF